LREQDISEFYRSEKQVRLDKKRAIDEFNKSLKQKSMIRYLTLIIDLSAASRNTELRPNRALVIKKNVGVCTLTRLMARQDFILDFFD